VINPIFYAEVSMGFAQPEEVDAVVRRYRLLTRDAARYRTYFPTVELIAP
jgi:hypothetical protein